MRRAANWLPPESGFPTGHSIRAEVWLLLPNNIFFYRASSALELPRGGLGVSGQPHSLRLWPLILPL